MFIATCATCQQLLYSVVAVRIVKGVHHVLKADLFEGMHSHSRPFAHTTKMNGMKYNDNNNQQMKSVTAVTQTPALAWFLAQEHTDDRQTRRGLLVCFRHSEGHHPVRFLAEPWSRQAKTQTCDAASDRTQ